MKQLAEASSAAWPATPAPYNKVKVFLMSWEKDDLDTDTELACLASIFQGLYHYDTESWKIPLRRSAAELSRKIASVIEADGKEGNLIIFYYTGHARANEHLDGRPVWFAKWDAPSPPFQISRQLTRNPQSYPQHPLRQVLRLSLPPRDYQLRHPSPLRLPACHPVQRDLEQEQSDRDPGGPSPRPQANPYDV